MFGVGGWELVFIILVVLLLFGPNKMPDFARTLGHFVREARKAADELQRQIRSAADEDR